MHGNRRLSRTRHSLHDQIALRRPADDLILFLLNRGYDLPKHRRLVSRKIFCQKLIVGNHIGIKKIFQLIVDDLIGPLTLQVNRINTFSLYRIGTCPRIVFIIN